VGHNGADSYYSGRAVPWLARGLTFRGSLGFELVKEAL